MQNAPELLPGLLLYYNAFCSLDRERISGFTEGYIPRKAVSDYAADYGFDDEQKDALHYLIGEMDATIMKLRKNKAESLRQSQPRRLTGKRR